MSANGLRGNEICLQSLRPFLILSFLLNAAVVIVGEIWRLSRVEGSIRKAIQKDIDKKFGSLCRDFDGRLESARRDTSEARKNVPEVEIFCRDTYVRRDSFYKVTDDLTSNMKTLGEKLEARKEKMEARIDNASRA